MASVAEFYIAVTLPSLCCVAANDPAPNLTPQMILAIGSVAYFLQASNLGWTAIATEFSHYSPEGTLRQVWYARYVDYTLTMPLLLLEFFFLTGLCTSDILMGCFMAAAWPACFLIGMLIRSTYKWPFFTFGVCFIIYLWYILLGPARTSAARMGRDFHTTYIIGAAWFCLMSLIYPIAWGCCEGGNTISTSSEFVWYGILDLFLKPFFLIAFLIMIGRLDLSRLQFYAGKYTDQNLGYPPHVHEAGAAVDNAGRGPVVAPVTTGRRGSGEHTIVDNPPRQKGKFFSRKGAHDVRPTNEKTPAATNTGHTTVHEPAVAPATTGAQTTDRHTHTTTDPVHTHNTKTRTVVHGHGADGEPRLSEATVVSDYDARYP